MTFSITFNITFTVPPYGGRIAQLPFQGNWLRTKKLLKEIKEIITVNKIQDQCPGNIILSRKAFFVTPTCTFVNISARFVLVFSYVILRISSAHLG